MTPYLLRSSLVHVALFSALAIAGPLDRAPKKAFYTIDFLGGLPGKWEGAGEASMPGAPASKPSARAAAKPEPLPSLKRWLPKAKAATLKAAEMAVEAKGKAPEAVEEQPIMAPSRREPQGATGDSSGGGPGPGTQVSTDLSAFPYPWYLARLRSQLWNAWAARDPRTGAVCIVSFLIASNGEISGVWVSQRSGDSDFDYAALSAVNAAAPFPPLPEDYREATLKVHVRFQSLP